MGMSHQLQPILHPVAIVDLRPTQMTVGLREVERKRGQWRDHARSNAATGGESKAGLFLGSHMIPAVIGPGGRYWLIDHHHLARALYDEGVENVLVSVEARLDSLPRKRFLAYMDAQNWLHPYDADGHRVGWDELPRHVGKLADDPFRSLAGEVRRAGGYAKTATPYTEFLWADFFRDRIRRHLIESKFRRAVDKGVALARSEAASYLPGYAGAHGGGGE